MYQAIQPSRSTFIEVREHRYHLRQWGTPESSEPPLVLLHGWMDVSASWQFMVDALRRPRAIVAPDWRGYGLTRFNGPAPDNFWFADYLADLDAMLDVIAPEQPVDLVGHSMGGNVAMLYAGVRPQRVRKLVNLEGFGMPATSPEQAPARFAQWLDELQALRRGEMALKGYDSAQAVARRLCKTNPRLNEGMALWLAHHWAAADAQGQWHILGDAAHKVVSAHLYQLPEALAIYARIAAPTLCINASDDSLSQWWKGRYTKAEYLQRLEHVPMLTQAQVHDAGHMLHHDQPQKLARLIEDFLQD